MIPHWKIVGASIIGRDHISQNMPCQDAHIFESLEGLTGIAIVSDGAGSCENSHLGSGFIVAKAHELMKVILKENNWLNTKHPPSEGEWRSCMRSQIKILQEELQQYADQENISYKSLGCTLIILLFSPNRILVSHLGDGRAGYADANGIWKHLITPYHGEQVGQTVFITSDIVIESDFDLLKTAIVNDTITSFTLLSDGCELACWKCYDRLDDREFYFDPNEPHQEFFEQNITALKSMHYEELPDDQIVMKWEKFLKNGNKALQREGDDKTLILGTLL